MSGSVHIFSRKELVDFLEKHGCEGRRGSKHEFIFDLPGEGGRVEISYVNSGNSVGRDLSCKVVKAFQGKQPPEGKSLQPMSRRL